MIDDGETLATVPDSPRDFVIANHFIEHTEDPIAHAAATTLRVLRPGGVLYMAVPDKRFTFDVDRPVTPLEHLVARSRDRTRRRRDARTTRNGRASSMQRAGAEAPRARELDDALLDPLPRLHARELRRRCWSTAATEAGIPLELEALVPAAHEFVAVLRRCP